MCSTAAVFVDSHIRTWWHLALPSMCKVTFSENSTSKRKPLSSPTISECRHQNVHISASHSVSLTAPFLVCMHQTSNIHIHLIFMEPCIVVQLVAITNKMQLSNGILLFHSTLTVQHVSSVMSLIIRNLNCICSFWFTYAFGDRPWCRLSGNSDGTMGGHHKRM